MPAVDPPRRIRRLEAAQHKAWSRAFIGSVDYILGALTEDRLTRLIGERADAEIYGVLDDAALWMSAQERQAFVGAGAEAADFLDGVLDAGLRKLRLEVGVFFDVTNSRAVEAIKANKLRLIREYSAAQRESVHRAMNPGVAGGLNPREQARAFRDSVSLTSRQRAAVSNFRSLLETGDAGALRRRLRDRRFDSSVRAAVEGRRPLTGAQIDRMVGRYRQRYVKYRAEVIGRTEALRSANQGTYEMYAQAVDSGALNPQGVVRSWLATADDRTRDTHRTMNGQRRELKEPFQSPSGALLAYPGDPAAPAAETIQCRCTVTTRIEDLTPTEAPAPDRSGAGVTTLPPPVPQYGEFGIFRPRTGGGDEGFRQRMIDFQNRPQGWFRDLPEYRDQDDLPLGVRDYLGTGHADLNRRLRDDLPLSDEQKAVLVEIEMEMAPTQSEHVAYRGEKAIKGVDLWSGVQPGVTHGFEQIVSTSLDVRVAASGHFMMGEGAVLWQIRVPTGTSAIVTNHFEYEMILGGKTKVRVLDVVGEAPQTRIFIAELVEEE